MGAILVGFLFKSEQLTYADAFQYIGIGVVFIGLMVVVTRFQPKLVAEVKPRELVFEQ